MRNFLTLALFSACLVTAAVLANPLGCGGDPPPSSTPDLASSVPQSCCGKVGDVGNSKGVGKYCTDPTGVECRSNSLATICSAIANTPSRKTYFCTTQCDPMVANYCGENASCTYDSVNKAYGCTPNACTMNMPAGCSL